MLSMSGLSMSRSVTGYLLTGVLLGTALNIQIAQGQYYGNPNSLINSLKPSFAQQSEEQMIDELQRQRQGQAVHRRKRKSGKQKPSDNPQNSTNQDNQPTAQPQPSQAAPAATGGKAGVHIQGLVPADQQRPVAFIDKAGRLVLPPQQYKSIANFSQGLACVLDSGNPPHYGYINPQGQWVIPPRYEMAGDFKLIEFKSGEMKPEHKPTESKPEKSNGIKPASLVLAPVKMGDKWGFINPNGDTVVPFEFDLVGEFSEGLAVMSQNDLFGYINPTGEIVIEARYETAEPFSNGLARVSEGDNNPKGHPQYSFINPQGVRMFDNAYDWASGFHNGLARVSDVPSQAPETVTLTSDTKSPPSRFGYMDTTGKLAIPLQFENAWPFQGDLALVKLNGKYGFINKSGKLVIPADFDWADEFHEGFAAARKNSDSQGSRQEYGFIDTHGKWAIDPIFAWVGNFSEGLAPISMVPDALKDTDTESPSAARQKPRYGFINKMGKLAIPPQYAWVKPFSSGLAAVEPVQHSQETGPVQP